MKSSFSIETASAADFLALLRLLHSANTRMLIRSQAAPECEGIAVFSVQRDRGPAVVRVPSVIDAGCPCRLGPEFEYLGAMLGGEAVQVRLEDREVFECLSIAAPCDGASDSFGCQRDDRVRVSGRHRVVEQTCRLDS